ncbi:c-type cytochrome [Legionella micdadei]|uniref:Cytochrome C oxidase, cbb3-type, subunit III n=1 Tax=Legionella micdadei TaxID=451 RepID=A0A098GFI3_LEGMI|nr:cytochrome c5 family protein [Legionella micdadei]KTD28195.1 cytochrome c5 [Legionella micdadei]NSL16824.1 cytochrome c5 family protein [Legionella micdadei]CEG61218.1 Cytochrome c5 [Legionella micdadei]SCY33178.1 Cytochrome C oxidase, cbb3-type, subunit III [Legionella micdadei]
MFRMLGFVVLGCLSFCHPQASQHHPQEFLQSIKGSKEEGKQIVQHFCASCHASNPLIPLGAPRIGEKDDWTPRIKQGINSMFSHTEEGFNAMPARGGCFECSDEQLMLAILFMLPESLREEVLVKKKITK